MTTRTDTGMKWPLIAGFALILTGCTQLGGNGLAPQAQLAPTSYKALAFQANANLGKNLSGAERQRLTQAEQQALDYGQVGQEIGWKSDEEADAGSITAFQVFRVGASNCRRFRHKIVSEGEVVTLDGTACRRQGGQWTLVQ